MVGSRIRKLRQQAGLSAMELAAKLKVDKHTVSRWEGGWSSMKPSPANLKKLARIFRCKVSDITGE